MYILFSYLCIYFHLHVYFIQLEHPQCHSRFYFQLFFFTSNFFSHRHTSFFQPLIFSRHIYISIRPHILFYFLSFFLSHSYPSHIFFFLSLTPFSLILDPECMCYAPSTIAISALLLTFSKLHLGRLIQIVIFIFLIMKRFQIYLIYLNFQMISYF